MLNQMVVVFPLFAIGYDDTHISSIVSRDGVSRTDSKPRRQSRGAANSTKGQKGGKTACPIAHECPINLDVCSSLSL
jgi:hypothetical protein